MRPCADVPEHLWVSDSRVTRSGGSHNPKGRMPWERVEGLALRMRENGDTWNDIAQALFEQTGIRITPKGVQDYMSRKWEV